MDKTKLLQQAIESLIDQEIRRARVIVPGRFPIGALAWNLAEPVAAAAAPALEEAYAEVWKRAKAHAELIRERDTDTLP